MWPGWWALALATAQRVIENKLAPDPLIGTSVVFVAFIIYLLLFLVGSIIMRGAGCTYNDLADQDIDDKIARTRSRPLPSGRVTRRQGYYFLFAQLVIGLGILLQFNTYAMVVGAASLIPVAIYPFMKRITWWPQLFLGFAFSWGALMGWAAIAGTISLPSILLYVGSIFWVIGYDTIYALQDIEDDAIVGVKSTARLFGKRVKLAITVLYAIALAIFTLATYFTFKDHLYYSSPIFIGLVLGGLHMLWQVKTLKSDDGNQCLKLFHSNKQFGWIFFLAIIASQLLIVWQ